MSNRLSDTIQAFAVIDPSREMIVDEALAATWGDFSAFREALSGLAPGSGAAIGVIVRNRTESAVAILGLLACGHCAVYFNGLQPPTRLIADIQGQKPAWIIGASADFDDALVEALAALGIRALVVDEALGLSRHPALVREGAGPFHSTPEGAAIEIQTSGTTGAPKRIVLPIKVVVESMLEGTRTAQGGGALQLKRSPALLFLPLAHAGGTFALLLSVFEGRPTVLFEKFRVENFRAALSRYRPRFISLPPPMLRMVLDSALTREDLSGLLAIRSGTAPLDPATQARFEERFDVPILITYGATEFMGALARWTLDEHKAFSATKRGSVGRPSPDVSIRIVDAETGELALAGEAGLLEVRGSRVQSGDWMRTNDLARLDEDNFLFILGRADDAIIRGGFKVMAGQVCDVLCRHPSVHEASVIGLPDPRLGEVPVAAVELKPDAPVVTPTELTAYARQHLIAYQVPARILIVPELPRTLSLKISRPDVRALFDALTPEKETQS